MGQEGEQFADAQPIHKVYVDGFWMDRDEVTNRQFRAFVQATGYVTVAERKPTCARVALRDRFPLSSPPRTPPSTQARWTP